MAIQLYIISNAIEATISYVFLIVGIIVRVAAFFSFLSLVAALFPLKQLYKYTLCK